MKRPVDNLVERRRYIRLDLPIEVSCLTPKDGKVYNVVAKNISSDGVRFETHSKTVAKDDAVELKLTLPALEKAVHAKGKVIWKRKISLEDRAPFDVGIEFTGIEEDNKNTFLKFLCDALYDIEKEKKNAKRKP